MSKYPVIVFEGIETSGKSTNIKLISKFLKKKKLKFIKFREPGGSNVSEKIRNILLDKKTKNETKTDLLLMLASRAENFKNLIKKNYKKKIILIDRFTDSTIAYQHYGMKINLKIINNLNKFILGKFKPDLTVLSLVNKENLKKRLNSRKKLNRYDKFKLKFYENVQNGYIQLSKNKEKKYLIIDSNKHSIKNIENKIIKRLDTFLKKWKTL